MADFNSNYKATTPYLNPFKRLGQFPLDSSEIFHSYDEALAYAKDETSTGYIGKPIIVVNDTDKTVKSYKIDHNRNLQADGTGSGSGDFDGSFDGGEV